MTTEHETARRDTAMRVLTTDELQGIAGGNIVRDIAIGVLSSWIYENRHKFSLAETTKKQLLNHPLF
jgi:hypothetical protein